MTELRYQDIKSAAYIEAIIHFAETLLGIRLKNVKKYFLRLASSGKRYSDVVTRFSLVKQKNGTGIEYSEIEVAVARQLEPEECAGAEKYGQALTPEAA